MKKIYLSMMFAASMCFAGNISTVASPYDVYNGFYIFNDGNTNLNGFKFYYYFNSAPEENMNLFSATVYRKQLSGSYVAEASVQPRSVHFERLSATQYRAILDFSNAVIPARGKFPVTGKPLNSYTSLAIQVNRINDNWARSKDKELRAYVVESLSGEVLVSKKIKYNASSNAYTTVSENRHPAIDTYRRIGVLTDESTCNEFRAGNQNNVQNMISLDVEDSGNQTSIQGAPVGIQKYGSFLRFKYCTLMFETMPKTPYDYMVLKLDTECPAGAYPVTRYHDTENNGNADSYSGNIWPSSVKGGSERAALQYCYVPKNSGSTLVYPVKKKYGVFATSDAHYVNNYNVTSSVFVDDENDNNKNGWYYKDVPTHLQSRMRAIMDGTHDTQYNVIKWTGSLAKSAGIAHTDNIAVENTLVAAAPLAPAVKGLNRNAVAVELKSAGDVKVSIVGVNGAVVANVAEKNLQAGVHQIKWNAGMAPNGRYIVKVEQNGMVNAKNVILK